MHRTSIIPPPFLPFRDIFCTPFEASFSVSKEQPFIASVTIGETSVKLIFELKSSAIKVSDFTCSSSTVLSASEEAAESGKDSAVVVIAVSVAVLNQIYFCFHTQILLFKRLTRYTAERSVQTVDNRKLWLSESIQTARVCGNPCTQGRL